MTELFYVTTVMKEAVGYKNVRLRWKVLDRQGSPPWADYAEMIAGYQDLDDVYRRRYARACVDESFSKDEAEALIRYLWSNFSEVIKEIAMGKIDLPMPNNVVPVSELYKCRGEGFHELYKTPGYDLPFKVVGDIAALFGERVFRQEEDGDDCPF